MELNEIFDEEIIKIVDCGHTFITSCKCKHHPPKEEGEQCSCPVLEEWPDDYED